jgi:LCP family protein required for cell wall assembly
MADPAVAGGRRRLGRRGRRLLGVVGAVALVLAAAWVAVARMGGPLGLAARWVVASPRHGPGAAGPAVSYRPQDPVTVLVMGTEVAPAYAGPQLTDSMMIVSYDPIHRTAAMMSVPRDLWVDIPGEGYQRINTAYEDTGPAGAELTVEKYFGVPIDYYAVVNYESLVRLVDAVGGVTVDVPYHIYDPCFPNALENACTVLNIPAGVQHMDGQEALAFARERHDVPGEDLGRQADQQALLLALRKALLRPTNLLRLPAIVGAVEGTVETNLPPAEIPGLVEAVLRLPRTAIHSQVLSFSTGAIANWTTPGGAAVLLPNPEVIRAEAAQLFSGALAAMQGATVQVEDGAPTDQPLATYFTSVLQGMGVATLPPETAARTDYRQNHVYVNTEVTRRAPAVAYQLAEMLGAPLAFAPFPSSQADVVVVLGAAFPDVVP